MTKRIAIDQAAPGMILESDVHARNGRFLLSQGTTLEEGHLRIFRIWGVAEVEIRDGFGAAAQGRAGPDLPEEIRLEAEAVVAGRIGPTSEGEHPAMAELRRILTQRTAHWLMTGPGQTVRFAAQSDQEPERGILEAPPMRMDPRRFLDEELELASLPALFSQIIEAIHNPRSSATFLAEVISRDQGLSATLLKIANSPVYGFPSQIDTISRAVTIVGTRQLSLLALGAAVITRFQDIPSDIMSMEIFWRQCVACGLGARVLAGARFLSNPESYFVAGMLHNLGQLVLLKYFPTQSRYTMLESRRRVVPLSVVEKEVFGFDHAWFGGAILKRWKLPARLEQAVRFQYAPSKSQFPEEVLMVHVAAILAKTMDPGWNPGYPLPALDCKAWDQVRLEPGLLAATLNLMASQVDGMYRLLFQRGGRGS